MKDPVAVFCLGFLMGAMSLFLLMDWAQTTP